MFPISETTDLNIDRFKGAGRQKTNALISNKSEPMSKTDLEAICQKRSKEGELSKDFAR